MESRTRGLGMVLLAATFWGLSGTAAQALFEDYGVSPFWLLSVRMVLGGLFLLLWARPAFPRARWGGMLLLALLGLVPVQGTYLLAIAYGNVASATLLQTLGIPLIALVERMWQRRPLPGRLLLGIALAFSGTALLVVERPETMELALSPLAIFWGLMAALTLMLYTFLSLPLVQTYGGWPVTAWGLFLGGLFLLPFVRPWELRAPLSWEALLLVIFVALVGTALAFGLYVGSLRWLRPAEAGLAVTWEPVVAAIAAYIFLQVVLRPWQYLGAALIVASLSLLPGLARPSSVPPLPAEEPAPPEASP
ncbi:MAG: DMT family transporter [Bacillota bacterium]|nr:DMT family transporter [Bacillota bacterium]